MSKSVLTLLVVLFLFAVQLHSHPSRYSDLDVGNPNCSLVLPEFRSYHIHVLFWGAKQEEVTAALALRTEFISIFNINESAPCDDSHTLDPPNYLCVWSPEIALESGSPFLTAMWASFIPKQYFATTVPWIMQHRSIFDVLVHPNSGCEIEDHRDWPVWGGSKWEVDLNAFHYDFPGGDIYKCIDSAKQLIFNSSYTSCGLQTSNNETFVLSNKSQFCSPSCVLWVKQLVNLPVKCPHTCDEWNQTPQQYNTCLLYINNADTLASWSASCPAQDKALRAAFKLMLSSAN